MGKLEEQVLNANRGTLIRTTKVRIVFSSSLSNQVIIGNYLLVLLLFENVLLNFAQTSPIQETIIISTH